MSDLSPFLHTAVRILPQRRIQLLHPKQYDTRTPTKIDEDRLRSLAGWGCSKQEMLDAGTHAPCDSRCFHKEREIEGERKGGREKELYGDRRWTARRMQHRIRDDRSSGASPSLCRSTFAQVHSDCIECGRISPRKGFNELDVARRVYVYIERQLDFFHKVFVVRTSPPSTTISQTGVNTAAAAHCKTARSHHLRERPSRARPRVTTASPVSSSIPTRRSARSARENSRMPAACILPTASGSSTYLAESSSGTRRRRSPARPPRSLRRGNVTLVLSRG